MNIFADIPDVEDDVDAVDEILSIVKREESKREIERELARLDNEEARRNLLDSGMLDMTETTGEDGWSTFDFNAMRDERTADDWVKEYQAAFEPSIRPRGGGLVSNIQTEPQPIDHRTDAMRYAWNFGIHVHRPISFLGRNATC